MTQGVAANGSGVADMATAAAGNAQATGPSPAAAGGAAGTTDGTAAVPNATDVARALGAPAQTTGTLKRPRKKYAKFPADVQKRIDALRAKIEVRDFGVPNPDPRSESKHDALRALTHTHTPARSLSLSFAIFRRTSTMGMPGTTFSRRSS